LKHRRNNIGSWEVLLDGVLVEIESLFDIHTMVKAVVPDVEDLIGIKLTLGKIFCLECLQCNQLSLSKGSELLFQVIEKLKIHPLTADLHKKDDKIYPNHICTAFNHLQFGDVICPVIIAKRSGYLAPNFNGTIQEGDVIRKARFKGFPVELSYVGMDGELELVASMSGVNEERLLRRLTIGKMSGVFSGISSKSSPVSL
jgi:hypothetical protein